MAHGRKIVPALGDVQFVYPRSMTEQISEQLKLQLQVQLQVQLHVQRPTELLK